MPVKTTEIVEKRLFTSGHYSISIDGIVARVGSSKYPLKTLHRLLKKYSYIKACYVSSENDDIALTMMCAEETLGWNIMNLTCVIEITESEIKVLGRNNGPDFSIVSIPYNGDITVLFVEVSKLFTSLLASGVEYLYSDFGDGGRLFIVFGPETDSDDEAV